MGPERVGSATSDSGPSKRARTAHGARPATEARPTSPPKRSPDRRAPGLGRGRAWLRWTPASSRQRSSGAAWSPRSSASTVSATSSWTATRSQFWISTTTSKVGGALRSSTIFWVPRRRASSSPSVTRLDAADQVRQRRVQHQVFERVAVRGGDELHAALGDRARRGRLELGADLVDDDDLGHVVLDRLDHHRVLQRRACGTCMRRARPMAGCGMSPSPAISFDVSTMMTRLSSRRRARARPRAASSSCRRRGGPGSGSLCPTRRCRR